MQSQWNNDKDVPEKMGQAWGKTKAGAGTGRVVAIAAGVVAVVLVVGVLVATLSSGDEGGDSGGGGKATGSADAKDEAGGGDKGKDPESGSYPKKGDYQVVHGDTGLCLTSGPEPGNKERDVMILGDCGKAYPKKMAWAPAEHRQYTVKLDFAKDNWMACLAVDEPADEWGYLMAGQDCDKKNDLQTFELWDQGDKKYSIAVKKTGMCLGPLEKAAKKGMAVSTVECSGGDKAQLFSLKK